MEGKNAERRHTGRKHPRFHQFTSAELIPHHSGFIFPFQSSRGGEGRVVLRYVRNISSFHLTPMISIQFLPCINFYQMDTGLTMETQGSSRGRGSRAAGWFDDYINSQQDPRMKSVVMVEGIKGWACAGEEYVALMDEYEEAAWRKEPR